MALAIPASQNAWHPSIRGRRRRETGGTLTIDLAAIEANWRTLVRELLTVECAAVVKANAYGLGLEPVTATLAKAGCKTFFVADIAEARSVRSRAAEATIYVLDGFAADWGDAFIEINARPVINSTTELAEWDAFVSAHILARRRGAAYRHRHASAWHFARGSGGACAARANRKSRHRAGHEPPRLRRYARIIR